MKTCTGCKEPRFLSDFYSNKSRPDGLANECRHCAADRRAARKNEQAKYDAERYVAERERILATRRVYHEANAYEIKMATIMRNYNVDAERYDQMLIVQNYKCAVDGCSASAFTETLAVDHDHLCCPEKGRSCGDCVRGLLCSNCNTALGLLRDDPRIIIGLLDYLLGEEV